MVYGGRKICSPTIHMPIITEQLQSQYQSGMLLGDMQAPRRISVKKNNSAALSKAEAPLLYGFTYLSGSAPAPNLPAPISGCLLPPVGVGTGSAKARGNDVPKVRADADAVIR